jgi:AcrR family transcriptional regulator
MVGRGGASELAVEPEVRRRPGRVQLMRTAVALMGDKGYDGTSTRDIAAAAGVSVAALYYHFPSKLDLLREFLHEAHDIVLARVARAVEQAGPDARERLAAAVQALVWSNIHDDFAKLAATVAWRENGRLEAAEQEAIAAKRVEMMDVLEAVIVDGVAQGAFSTTDPRPVASAVLTLCISVVDPLPEMGASLDDVIELHQRLAAALCNTEAKA